MLFLTGFFCFELMIQSCQLTLRSWPTSIH